MSARRMRPMQGQVLVELIPVVHETPSGLVLPETRRLKDSIGRIPAQRARVLACGVWPTTRSGMPIGYEYRRGNIVLVDPVLGKNISPDRATVKLKLYDHKEILAKELTGE